MDESLVRQAELAIAQGSGSFAAASRLFDRETRRSVVMLYAWCRHCDDVVDGQRLGWGQTAQEPAAALRRVEELVAQTGLALRGGADTLPAPFRALAEVARRHRIPHRYAFEHLSGFGMDALGRRYDGFGDTLDYCYRVAGVVGVMMAMVMGRRDDATLDRAAHLGLAFQLTNIARDVLDDHAAGRLYLPADWLAEEGVPPAGVGDVRHRAAVARVAHRLVDAAEPYYRSAAEGVARLPLRSAWAVAAARGMYREIGWELKSRGMAAWEQRVATPRHRKLRHLFTAGVTAAISRWQPADRTPLREPLWVRPRA